MTVRDKIYAVEIQTPSYEFVIASRTEETLMDALTFYAIWEAKRFLDFVQIVNDYLIPNRERVIQELKIAIEMANPFDIRDVLSKHHRNFKYTFHIVHKPFPISCVYMARNWDYAERPAEEILPTVFWLDSKEISDFREANIDPNYYEVPVFMVNEPESMNITTEYGGIHIFLG